MKCYSFEIQPGIDSGDRSRQNPYLVQRGLGLTKKKTPLFFYHSSLMLSSTSEIAWLAVMIDAKV